MFFREFSLHNHNTFISILKIYDDIVPSESLNVDSYKKQ